MFEIFGEMEINHPLESGEVKEVENGLPRAFESREGSGFSARPPNRRCFGEGGSRDSRQQPHLPLHRRMPSGRAVTFIRRPERKNQFRKAGQSPATQD